MQLTPRDPRSGFLPLFVVIVADEDFAPAVGLRAMDMLRGSSSCCGLKETHAGLRSGPRLDGTTFLASHGLHGADAIQMEAGDFCCWGVMLR